MDKNALAIMILKGRKNKEKMVDDEPQGDDDEAPMNDLKAVAQDLIDAVKSEDASAVADALKAAHMVCSKGSEDYEEEDSEEEE